MELSTWAERVLTGTALADKLADPGRLRDTRPGGGWSVPDSPPRPALVPIPPPGERPPPTTTPSTEALRDPGVRADLLLRFAHHELQALELMALALLRFPDADPDTRRVLASTLRDEQRHCRDYLARVEALRGRALEPEPGSRFFWDLLADADSIEAFIAGMSLTLEQANLDFLSHWRDRFEAVGDTESVALLEAVHRDEVRHVRHGASFLAQTDPDRPLFEAWTARLRAPLTPRRGRGPRFDAEARRRAGLDEDFITRVRAAGASKGRTPRLLWLHPWVELEHAQPGFTPPRVLRELAADLAPTLAALAGEDDVLVVPEPPDPAARAALARRGWPVPALAIGDGPDAFEGEVRALQPWGWSASTARTTAHLQVQQPRAFHPDTARLARKDTAARALAALAEDPAWVDDPRLDTVAGMLCATPAEVGKARGAWARSVVKAPWSAAGRGVWPGPIDVDRLLSRHGSLLVEPWRERVLDLSLQAEITDEGIRDAHLVRFLTTPSGGFRGVALGAWDRGLPVELRRFLAGDGRDPRFVTRALRAGLRHALTACPGHRGPVGVDALVARIDGSLRLRPLVEVNPRWTFGRVGRAVGRHLLARGRAGVWLHVSRRDLGSCTTFEEAATRLAHLAPAEGSPLVRGALATTDPRSARRVWTVLIAGDTVEDALGVWERCTG